MLAPPVCSQVYSQAYDQVGNDVYHLVYDLDREDHSQMLALWRATADHSRQVPESWRDCRGSPGSLLSRDLPQSHWRPTERMPQW